MSAQLGAEPDDEKAKHSQRKLLDESTYSDKLYHLCIQVFKHTCIIKKKNRNFGQKD